MITLKVKSQSFLMRFFAFFLGKDFLNNFNTTICNTIYAPSVDEIKAHSEQLAHELVHVYLYQTNFFYNLMYLTFWRAEFEAQGYAMEAWYRHTYGDGIDIQTYFTYFANTYFTPWGAYLFPWWVKKPVYKEPSDAQKKFVMDHIQALIKG